MKTVQLSEETIQELRNINEAKIHNLRTQLEMIEEDQLNLSGSFSVEEPVKAISGLEKTEPSKVVVRYIQKKRINGYKKGFKTDIVAALAKAGKKMSASEIAQAIKGKYGISYGKKLEALEKSLGAMLNIYSVGKYAGYFDREKVKGVFVYNVNVHKKHDSAAPQNVGFGN